MIKVINFFKNNYWTLLKVMFGLFILYYLIFFLTPKINISVSEKKQIDSLNVLVKQLHQDNLDLEKNIEEYNEKIFDIDNKIMNIKGQKTIIKEIYHEKINSVDRLTVRELDSFFTDRYKQ